jgi:ribosome assembly protein 4
MSTVLPPKAKRQKREELQRATEQQPLSQLVPDDVPNVVVQLRASDTGSQLGGELHIPGNATAQQLDQLVNKLLGTVFSLTGLPYKLLT